ncbi:hypothetical protein AVEN_157234-1, partial [Araneus ventricosus]
THRTVSTQLSHCFSDTCSFSDGEKCLNHIQTSSRSEISTTYAQGAARKCFRAKWRNTGWGCR